jgi:hypothetical protein
MDECGYDRSAFVLKASREIRDDVTEIEYAIKELEPKKALELIQKMKSNY